MMVAVCAFAMAQKVSDVSFTLRADTLQIIYSLDKSADIRVRLVESGRYSEPLQGFTGAVGEKVKAGNGLVMTAVGLPEIRGIDSADLAFVVEVDDGSVLVQLDSLLFRMMPVAGGSFVMGCAHPRGEHNTYTDEIPTHKVTVDSFYIGQHEVTQALWTAVMGSNPSKWKGNDSLPVEQVTWNDVQIFIARLSQLTGYRFRLPTEAEWEFAARGGNRSHKTNYPGTRGKLDEYCWYGNNSHGHSHVVGQLKPNELGLYDMGGNVMEWCSDWMEPYTKEEQVNPQGPKQGDNRILRGGCFNSPTWGCSVYERSWYLPEFGYPFYGFRLAIDNAEREEE